MDVVQIWFYNKVYNTCKWISFVRVIRGSNLAPTEQLASGNAFEKHSVDFTYYFSKTYILIINNHQLYLKKN